MADAFVRSGAPISKYLEFLEYEYMYKHPNFRAKQIAMIVPDHLIQLRGICENESHKPIEQRIVYEIPGHIQVNRQFTERHGIQHMKQLIDTYKQLYGFGQQTTHQ